MDGKQQGTLSTALSCVSLPVAYHILSPAVLTSIKRSPLHDGPNVLGVKIKLEASPLCPLVHLRILHQSEERDETAAHKENSHSRPEQFQ